MMADLKRARPGNRPGDFFVDETCIDCDTCRWVARGLFTSVGDGSAVTRQPATPEERRRAFLALKACPTHSIGCTGDKKGLVEAEFPLKIAENLYYLGYASESSFGAASFLLVRDGHSVMIDSPRYHEPLAKAIEALGPVRWLVLTHRDDIADQAKWAERLSCKRVLHKDDVPRSARDIEVQPQGLEPVLLEPGMSFIPVPGHTIGHAVLHIDDRYLFTGDHLYFSESKQSLRAFRDACWYDWAEQSRSMQRLLPLKFEWVLPGHGRMKQAPAAQMSAWLKDCVDWMKA
jgi:glyoxylase-like metal-dependent hydrolase (beta-lactamase superfamily II)/ferredoxin